MKIIDIRISKLDLVLNKPFSYFTATLNTLPYMLVEVITDAKITGHGEAALAWDITGETQSGALELVKFIKPIILNKSLENLDSIAALMDELNSYISGNSGLKSGIEMAMLDVLGKYKNKPVYKLFSDKEVDFIIPQKVLSYEDQISSKLKEVLLEAKQDGVKIFKLKSGQGAVKDVAMVERIFSIDPEINLVLDVNQGWRDAKTALLINKQLEKFNILWIEQPIYYKDYNGMSEIKLLSKLPVMADESCHDILDLENLHKREAIDLINIKIAKCGGILMAIKMINYCKQYKIKYMIGDMINSSIGTAANIHLAAIASPVSVDFTFPDRIKNDQWTGARVEGHKFFLPQGAGLGIGSC